MNVVTLYIGLPKTGTSAVQRILVSARDQALQQGVWIPKSIMDCHRFSVDTRAADDERLALPHYQRVLQRGAADIGAQVADAFAQGKSVLLSSEYFFSGDAARVAAHLQALGVPADRVRVVVCLRRQDRYLASSYNQEVKATGRTSALVWSETNSAPLDWEKRLQPWSDAFGSERVRVLSYERLTSHADPWHFIASMIAACGLEFTAEQIKAFVSAEPDRVNRSLPEELLWFRRQINSLSIANDMDWLMGRALELGVGQTRHRLPVELSKRMVTSYRESNRAVAEKYLPGGPALFDERIDADSAPVDDAGMRIETLAKLVGIIAADRKPPAMPVHPQKKRTS